MNISEFKAFLEGMDVKGAPTEKQWKRISEKIESLSVPAIADIPKGILDTSPVVHWPAAIDPYDYTPIPIVTY